MKITALLFRFGAFGFALLLFVASSRELIAQAVAETPPVKSPAAPEELSQAELLKSYLQLREQLHATQLAIGISRAEAEAAARAQAAAIAEKLEGIKAAIETERERHRLEMDRSNAERERIRTETLRANAEREQRQTEVERSNRNVLWAVGACGGLGLLALLLTPVFQWWTIKRLSASAWREPLAAGNSPQLLTEGAANIAAADQTVAVSNQRLMSAIDRMEKRISDFETRWVTPVPFPATSSNTMVAGPTGSRPAISIVELAPRPAEQPTRISVLLAKGQSLVDMGKTVEALGCYNEVLKIDLNHPEALVKRGAALEKLKQDDEAIQCYDRAIKADRKMTLAYLHKGAVCNRLERYEEALKCYQQALLVEEEAK